MRNAQHPNISDHRLTRFLTLVWLRVLRMAGRLLVGEAPYREDLNAFSRFVAAFILIRAARSIERGKAAPSPRPSRAPPGFRKRALPTPFALVRAAAGSRLRRQLRGRDALAHISALIAAILNLNSLVARTAQRLERRLTRLRPIELAYAAADARAGLPSARQAQSADTS
jgi:hypothetical protein